MEKNERKAHNHQHAQHHEEEHPHHSHEHHHEEGHPHEKECGCGHPHHSHSHCHEEGYYHKERGTRHLTTQEKKLVDIVKRAWYNRKSVSA